MNVKILKQEALACEMEITIPANDIDHAAEAELAKVGKTVSLPGFRKGKVPLAVLKSKYGKAIMGDVLENVVQSSSAKAMQDNKIKPALQPKVEVKSFDEGKDLVYTLSVETLPEIKVMDLKSIKIEKPVAKVEDKVVAEALERITSQNGEPKDLEKARPSKNDDMLVIDFVGKTDDGMALPGMTATDFNVRLGSNSLIPGFEDQLIGKNIGDKVDVKVTFPDQYHEPSLAGKPSTFETTIKAIKEFVVPAADDAFAKKLGFPDLAGLKKAIENQLSADYGRHTRMKVKRALLDVLDDNHKIVLPAGMVDLEFKSIVQQVEAEAHQKAHAAGECNHDHDHEAHSHLSDEEKAELQTIAERRVRLGLVLAEVGQANNITVNDGELQRAVFAEAGRYPGQEKFVLEYYRKNRAALESLRAPIFEEKVVDFILELANVTEVPVSVEDLLKEDEGDVKPAAKAKKATKAKAEKVDDESAPEAAAEAKPKKAAAKKKAE